MSKSNKKLYKAILVTMYVTQVITKKWVIEPICDN